MPKYQINSIDEKTGHVEVVFTSDSDVQLTEIMGDLPLDDAQSTKDELSRRLNAWQSLLHVNNEHVAQSEPDKDIDPALESILHKIQEVEYVEPVSEESGLTPVNEEI